MTIVVNLKPTFLYCPTKCLLLLFLLSGQHLGWHVASPAICKPHTVHQSNCSIVLANEVKNRTHSTNDNHNTSSTVSDGIKATLNKTVSFGPSINGDVADIYRTQGADITDQCSSEGNLAEVTEPSMSAKLLSENRPIEPCNMTSQCN